jgi:hypothetical protein
VSILQELGLMWEFGFMLFDPSSTFDSVREHVTFLRQIVNDGSVAATFCNIVYSWQLYIMGISCSSSPDEEQNQDEKEAADHYGVAIVLEQKTTIL